MLMPWPRPRSTRTDRRADSEVAAGTVQASRSEFGCYATIGHDRRVTNRRRLDLSIDIDDEEQLAELERALLRARATELGEVRRRNVRFTAGYGDATTRDVLDDEGRRAQIRHDVLSRLIDALRAVRS